MSTISVKGKGTFESLRNPCPPGTGMGYATLNGSDLLFIICDAAFKSTITTDNTTLILALTLGIGIPVVSIIILMRHYREICWCRQPRKSVVDIYTSFNTLPTIFQTPSKDNIRALLSTSALQDFKYGSLTSSLKEELMMLRIKLGREMTEFVEYAKELHHSDLATYINTLNPGTFPRELINKVLHIQTTNNDAQP
jgi:hypothetical protein